MTISDLTLKKKIILFGPPGAGKGTLTGVIKKYLPEIVHISTGDIFRENISKKTPLGINAKEYIDKGALVPDAIVIALVKDRLNRDDVKNNGYILDGFPRTIDQARALSEITRPDIFLLLDPPRDLLIKRIKGRYSCQYCGKIYNKYILPPKHEGVCDKCGSEIEFKQRADDNEEALNTRLEGYDNKSRSIVEYYEKKGILKRIKTPFILELTSEEIRNLIELLVLNICIPMQVKSDKIEEVQAKINKIKNSQPEYIEFRLDYIQDISLLTPTFLNKLIELSQDKEIKVILTFRKSTEGGKTEIDEKTRLEIIKKMITALPDYIDIEMSSNDEFIRKAVSLAFQYQVKIIFSYHNFEKTPSLDDVKNLITEFDNRLVKKLSIGAITTESFPFKLIFTAQSFYDNLVPIKICQKLSETRRNIISFCMGELGVFSRVSCVRYGALFTFASLEETTAPGQISINEMKEAHKILYKS
ncbi:MAG: type I 3-dehydroquinate dehydratase [Promethearchaeota archaeon]